ncbi:SMI1/KNR4 family protein [Corynebacterium uberis]|nr:SMI1/KNR4 family protein [Corynebacterium uberis]UDL76104.1 SMI1/KNR4 family protein [Corynebacterium uberis]UDL80599.1 SMI1/KNR4 family protein [Corynebacterium uberis]UDL82734.1 SMI1/KNR4 family protein [Corynebacterium uberis]UDL84941.1 SMI1/KNR4 family protein [Corynebacterium uberis]
MLRFSLSYGSFDLCKLREIERRMGGDLPLDLWEFLSKYGCGFVGKNGLCDFFFYPELPLDASIEYFCTAKEYEQYFNYGLNNGWWPFMPPKSLPFAWGPGVEWDIYYAGPDRGKVFVLKHDEGPEDEPEYWDIENGSNLPYHEYIHVLANSFDELMDQILVLEDVEDE